MPASYEDVANLEHLISLGERINELLAENQVLKKELGIARSYLLELTPGGSKFFVRNKKDEYYPDAKACFDYAKKRQDFLAQLVMAKVKEVRALEAQLQASENAKIKWDDPYDPYSYGYEDGHPLDHGDR